MRTFILKFVVISSKGFRVVTREQGVKWDPVDTAYKDGILAPAPNTFGVFKFFSLFGIGKRKPMASS